MKIENSEAYEYWANSLKKKKYALEKGYYFKSCIAKQKLIALDIEKELLQYRRENNIFEVGDKVVLIKGNRALLVMIVVEVKDRTMCVKNREGATIIFNKLHIRHATDKEIAQGYRDE